MRLSFLGPDPGAGVADVDPHGAVVGRRRELHPSSVGCPAERVREQVRHDLQHAVAVRDDRRRLPVVDEQVLDLATPRLFLERAVCLLHEPVHVDLLRTHGEAMRVELGEIEHVADEPLEPDRFRGDDVERRLHELRVVDQSVAQRVDVTLDRGQRACAARARRTSGTGAHAARSPPASPAIWLKRRNRWPISSPRPAGTRTS